MSTTVRIDEELYNQARITAKLEHRSLNGQIEYWTKLGRICEENPDLYVNYHRLLSMLKVNRKTPPVTPPPKT